MPHGVSTTLPDDVAEAAQRFLRAPGGIGGVGSGIESIASASVDLAESNAAADLAPAAIPVIGAIAEFLGISVGWVIFLAIIAVLALLRIIEAVLVRVCDAIPWNFGNGPKAFITAVFHPLDVAENWCIHQIIDGAQSLIHLIIKAGELTFGMFFGQQVNSGAAPDSITTRHMLADIATLKREYAAIENELHQIDSELAVIPLGFTTGGPAPYPSPIIPPTSGSPGTTSGSTTTVPAPILPSTGAYPSITQFNTLTHRVTTLMNEIPVIIHDINVIESNQHQFSNDLNSLKDELTGLRANLGSVRAVQVGVQDTLSYLTSTVEKLDFDYGQLAPQVQAHTNQLHSMHPLEQLLFLGQPGLNNLKKLEQNMCQCPKYPGLNGDMAGGLALYEFLTNG